MWRYSIVERILRLDGDCYQTQQFSPGQLIVSATFPEIQLSVEAVLRNGQV